MVDIQPEVFGRDKPYRFGKFCQGQQTHPKEDQKANGGGKKSQAAHQCQFAFEG